MNSNEQARPFQALSFDCYGTLIDWERGLATAIRAELGIEDPAQVRLLIATRADAEWNLLTEMQEFESYRTILAHSLVEAGRALEIVVSESGAQRVAATIGLWPLFPDVEPALRRLAPQFRLGIVSNVDREDLARTLGRLELPFECCISADQVQCYKPEPDHLMALVHEMELDEDELLHVSAYPDYDLATAQDLGIPAAYIDRLGEAPDEELELRYRVEDLGALADRLLKQAKNLRRRPRGK